MQKNRKLLQGPPVNALVATPACLPIAPFGISSILFSPSSFPGCTFFFFFLSEMGWGESHFLQTFLFGSDFDTSSFMKEDG